MADTFVEGAITHWAPRFLQNGVDHGDFVRISGQLDDWPGWLATWSAAADEHAKVAEEAEAAGHSVTAGHAWRRASTYRHFGKFVWMLDAAAVQEATLRSAREMAKAHALLDPTAERLVIDLDGGFAHANLRRPVGTPVAPYVVLIPGLDSTKEEFFFLEEAYLARGMATISLDGPGQGETGLHLPIRADYEIAVSALLDHLADRDDLDHQRIGLVGVSLGGYYATRATAFEPRVTALTAISGPFNFGEFWADLPPHTTETFAIKSGAADAVDAEQKALTLDLTDVCRRISVPSIFVTGDRDRIIPWEQTQRQAAETPGGLFINYPGGSHGVTNMNTIARPMMADWMSEQLGITKPQ